MVYNEDLKMIILHGGDPRDSPSQTTWGWNGSTWNKIADEHIFAMALGYDANRKVVVAYGSTDARQSDLGLWELKNNRWTRIAEYGEWNSADYRKRWISQHPDDVMPLIQEGFNSLFSKQFAESEAAYKKIEKVYPRKVSMLINLIYALLMQDKVAEAEMYIKKIDKPDLMSRRSYMRLGGYLTRAKKNLEAAKYYEKALALKPRAPDFYSLACAYAKSNVNDQAFVALGKAIEYGFRSRQRFENDPDLASLKPDKRFNELMDRIK
jgi:tetratricopeptide (TPR) repeat protein